MACRCAPLVNATFLAAALAAGLDLAIVNPESRRMMEVVDAWRVLSGEDESARSYVERYAGRTDAAPATPSAPAPLVPGTSGALAQGPADAVARARGLVLDGRTAPMAAAVRELLAEREPLAVINEVLVPALDEVGRRFEAGTFFLPQLMASAEAAKAGFDGRRERRALPAAEQRREQGRRSSSATVKGDIHDIGKNIVRMLLENYGFAVADLGRDVDAAGGRRRGCRTPRAARRPLCAHDLDGAGHGARPSSSSATRRPGARWWWGARCSRPSTRTWSAPTSTRVTPWRPSALRARFWASRGACGLWGRPPPVMYSLPMAGKKKLQVDSSGTNASSIATVHNRLRPLLPARKAALRGPLFSRFGAAGAKCAAWERKMTARPGARPGEALQTMPPTCVNAGWKAMCQLSAR